MKDYGNPYALLASVERSRRYGVEKAILKAVRCGWSAKKMQPLFEYRATLNLENEFEFHSYCVADGGSAIEAEDWRPIIDGIETFDPTEIIGRLWDEKDDTDDEAEWTIDGIERRRERRADLAILKAARDRWPEEAAEVLVAYRQRLGIRGRVPEAEPFPRPPADPFNDPFEVPD